MRRRTATRALASAVVAACALAAGCTARLGDLSGARSVTEWVPSSGPADRFVDVPAEFVLRNRSLGSVRVGSVRLPISTVVETDPRLPATIAPGHELRVRVTGRFRPSDGNRVRTVLLENAGDAPLELTLDGRVKPMPPSDAAAPKPVSPG